jgi:orotate phosphoribosyltransferase
MKNLIEKLKSLGIVKFGDFTLSSGKKSNYYVDAKALSLVGYALHPVVTTLVSKINQDYPEIRSFGGMELGSVSLLGSILMHFSTFKEVSGFIVRKSPKNYGTGNLIEGTVGSEVILLEDVCTTGKTVGAAVQMLQSLCSVKAVYCIVDREEGASETLHSLGVPLFALIRGKDLL